MDTGEMQAVINNVRGLFQFVGLGDLFLFAAILFLVVALVVSLIVLLRWSVGYYEMRSELTKIRSTLQDTDHKIDAILLDTPRPSKPAVEPAESSLKKEKGLEKNRSLWSLNSH